MMTDFYTKNGYDVEVIVGSLYLNTNLLAKNYGLCDSLAVNAQVNQARTASFSFIPPESTINLESYQGKQVIILVRTASDGWQQVFKGYVDTPKIDFIARKITLDCSDNRSNKIIQLPSGVVSSIGTYSTTIFGVTNDKSDELEKRLQTVLADFDFDRFGNWQLTSWTPKATADFTLTSSDISYSVNPQVSYTNRSKTINTVNIQVSYSYQRLHHQCVNVAWNNFPDFLGWFYNGKPSFPQRSTIEAAANAGSWRVQNSGYITFGSLWPAQAYQGTTGVILWNPNQVINETAPRTKYTGYLKDGSGNLVTDSSGNYVKQYQPVTDSNGNQLMTIVKQTTIDTSSHLCISASWVAATDFAQTVTEVYNIKLTAPQSTAIYGVIDSYQQISLTDDFDTGSWEKGGSSTYTNYNYYVDKRLNPTAVNNAITCALQKARHDILQTHRDVVVSFRTVFLRPTIDIVHTVDATIDQSAIGDTASIQTKGKVSSVSHMVDFNTLEAYTTVTLNLSRSTGSASNSTWTINTPVQNPGYINQTVTSVALASHFGSDPATNPASSSWSGWIANINYQSGYNTFRTNFTEQFRVDYPAIPSIIREPITYSSTSNFNLAIPNDTLDMSF